LSTSLLQIARAYTVFARDGQIIPITLQRHDATVEGPQVLSPATARAVREMLHSVTLPGGTAPRAQTIGYSVGGKTGTAHRQEGRGYAGHRYRAWFVGMAPISDPRLIVAVMIDDPTAGEYFGGDVAAPVFSRVVQESLRILGVANDIPVKTQIATVAAVPESF
jgi:cell division protein FtsI (penicillin-binding protein 3)